MLFNHYGPDKMRSPLGCNVRAQKERGKIKAEAEGGRHCKFKASGVKVINCWRHVFENSCFNVLACLLNLNLCLSVNTSDTIRNRSFT